MEEMQIIEFRYDNSHFNGGFGTAVNDLKGINGFDDYFQLNNNVLIRADNSKPFTGKINLYKYFDSRRYKDIELATEINSISELFFENGFLYLLEYTYNRTNGTIDHHSKYNVFSFFDDQKQMKYYFHLLEGYSYFDNILPDGTLVNNLLRHSLTEDIIPGGLYKVTRNFTDGRKDEEGYSQGIIIPQYYEPDDHYGYEGGMGWGYASGKVGIWRSYSLFDEEEYSEQMWGLQNILIDDIKTYKIRE